MNFPNVERIYSEPRMSRHDAEDHFYAQRAADEKANYERLLGEAGTAIRALPYEHVTHETISTLLNALSCKAMQAMLPEIAEDLEILADEVNP